VGIRKSNWLEVLCRCRYFMKEISSDGDLSTVDVIYPASPFYLHYSPELLRLLLVPLLAYANNETSVPYDLPWAPHHLVRRLSLSWLPHPHHIFVQGVYPIGYILSRDQENMYLLGLIFVGRLLSVSFLMIPCRPVEETGNLFMMLLGIIQRQKNDYSWLFPRYQVNHLIGRKNKQRCSHSM